MAIVMEKRGLHFGVGEGDALTNPEWEVERFLEEEDGTREALGRKRIPATMEEIEALFGEAATALDSKTSSLMQTIADRDKVIAEKNKTIADLTAQRDGALAVIQKVTTAVAT